MSNALVQCVRCGNRTTPVVAQAYWAQGVCRCCQNPAEGDAVRRKLDLASAAFKRMDAENGDG